MNGYRRVSRQVFQVLETITPTMEAASIDEAYLDVSGLEKLVGAPEAIGREIKRRICTETELTASVGVGPNRRIAKLGSEYRKPDGLTVVRLSDPAHSGLHLADDTGQHMVYSVIERREA